MKKAALLAIGMALAISSQAQGYFNFVNAGGGDAQGWKVAQTDGVAGQGAAGAFLGSDYSIGYRVAVGTFADLSTFLAASPTLGSQTVAFFGATGGGPTVDGGGLFDFGAGAGAGDSRAFITSPATADATMVTIQLMAWYNGAGATSYATALAAGANTGLSSLLSVRLAAGADPVVADFNSTPGFTVAGPVAPVPEPTSFALAGLGAAAMLIFRRRK